MRSTRSGHWLNGSRGAALVAVLTAAILGGTACSGDSSSSTSSSGSAPLSVSSASAAALTTTTAPSTATTTATMSATVSATPTTPKPTSSTTLGGDCSSVLPLVDVDKAVGKTVPGKSSLIVNIPDYSIFQVERINCQYGLLTPKGKTTPAAPLVEASVSLYNSNAHATARVNATEETWREHSATPHKVAVAGHAGVVLTGYGPPLLVLGVGPRTFAIGISTKLVAPARVDAALVALAASALHGSGG